MNKKYIIQIWTDYETWGDIVELPEATWRNDFERMKLSLPMDQLRVVLRITFDKVEIPIS